MKEMIYSAKRLKTPEIIAEGIYREFKYYVLNLGTHPCAYIDVTDTSLNGIHYSKIDIDCHGGLTYSEDSLVTVNKIGWFIGWDYAHYCDYVGYDVADYSGKFSFLLEAKENGVKWTTQEIVNECKKVIDQLAKIRLDEAIAEIKRWQKAEIGVIE